MAEPNKQKALQVHVPEHLRGAVSANIVRVTTTNQGEVILDFVFAHPQDIQQDGSQVGTLISRVILPLNVARDLHTILNSHLGKVKSE